MTTDNQLLEYEDFECPVCHADGWVAFRILDVDDAYTVEVNAVRAGGCEHLDAWRPGPRGDSGEPVPIPLAA